ncbi:T9SS type A sorting domain-containing protein [Chryseobacterium herbae]|uniref:T9SS type A sorting domain-containing protein n=1 Tax=Chryseobacterium herbae TaxID=2976476 RepID=A0ABT2INX4_9FLAO|nr:T9SS type A sorting domain-containing protein [Chryseobacterium sp. pc1-10]MCT2560520.1 T9SS type A sorting domain-containing protein [Chryseobacterium sp. pc1-10]
MKTKEYEFIKKHSVLLDSTAENERSDLFTDVKQRCFKKIPLFLLCSTIISLSSPHFRAQTKISESVHEKPYPANEIISLYGKERNDLSANIQRKFTNATPIELYSKEIKEVLTGQDYFPADVFLNEDYKTNVKAPSGHNTQARHYDGCDVIFDGQMHKGLTVHEIIDQYTLKNKITESDYHYDNIYYIFRDATGNTLATVYYIDRTVGFLKSEYKVVSTGRSLITFPLLVAPNPAKHMINITYQVEKDSQASLQIVDMNGRTADTVFSDKQIKSGKYTIQHNINLPAGNYLIQFNAQGQASVTRKIIVQ